ncbi:MAG: outer membrane protein [Rickettsiaceae bacterium]|nr:outer membrane protein [Rickettsiaceae bacterium]
MAEGNSVRIEKSALKFSDFHKIEVKIDGIKLLLGGAQEILLPQIDAKFSLFDLALLRTIPSEIKITNPEIDIDNSKEQPNIAINGLTSQEILLQKEYFSQLLPVFLSLKDGKVAIKKFSINNAKINFKNKKGQKTIILKELRIRTFFSDGYLNLRSQNKINIDAKLPDFLFGTNCQLKLDDGLKCGIAFRNLSPASFAFIDDKLSPLKEIGGSFTGNINFTVNADHSLSWASFNINSQAGSFNYPQFFSEKIDFNNLSLSGNLNNDKKSFSINNLNCDFGGTKFAMSLLASDFLDKNLQKMKMQFKVNNVRTNELKKFWPVFLNQNDIRSWVIDHISDGAIKDGYATIILASKNGVQEVQKVDSELLFSGLNLQYDQNFPPISGAEGIASFTAKRMKIDITDGAVLKSKINSAEITIPDFNSKTTMLLINGRLAGAAEDLLKYISYKSKFATEIDKYFNGQAESILDIRIPLTNNLDLDDVYIKVGSAIQNFNNDYLTNDSNLKVAVEKKLGNSDFLTEIDLTNATINLSDFAIDKKSGIASKIKTILSFKDDNLRLKNIDWQEENKSLKGNLWLKLEPLKVMEINLKNQNFANSNFNLNYRVDDDFRFVRLKGKQLDLKNILSANHESGGGLEHYQRNDIEITLDKIELANGQIFRNTAIDINCEGSKCASGFIRTRMSPSQTIDIAVSKPGNKTITGPGVIEGKIDDISLLAKAFDLSNKIVGGNAKIKAELEDEGKLKVKLNIDSDFKILKNEVVEKIYNNNAFAKLKEESLKADAVKFNNLKLEFVLQNNLMDITTLIANSYIMGITAKGKIDLAKNDIQLKGLIVPGYVINKLFGIGKVPILGKIIVGEEGGGIFAIRYDYIKKSGEKNGEFSINPASAVIPGGIRNIFDLF